MRRLAAAWPTSLTVCRTADRRRMPRSFRRSAHSLGKGEAIPNHGNSYKFSWRAYDQWTQSERAVAPLGGSNRTQQQLVDSWAKRSECWLKESQPKRTRRRREREKNPLILTGRGLSIRVDKGCLLVRDGFTHYPADRWEWRFFNGELDVETRDHSCRPFAAVSSTKVNYNPRSSSFTRSDCLRALR